MCGHYLKGVYREQFDFEKLDIYKISIQYTVVSDGILKEIPRGNGHLVDQLQRASTSIVLNLCEGSGEYSKSEKARFYRISRRSATECASVLEILKVLKLVDNEKLNLGREFLFLGREFLLRIVSMLTKMVIKLEETVKT